MILFISRLICNKLLGINITKCVNKPLIDSIYIVPSIEPRLDKLIIHLIHTNCKYKYRIVYNIEEIGIQLVDEIIYLVISENDVKNIYKQLVTEKTQNIWIFQFDIFSKWDNINILSSFYPYALHIKSDPNYDMVITKHISNSTYHWSIIMIFAYYICLTVKHLLLFKNVFFPLLLLETTCENILHGRHLFLDNMLLICVIIYIFYDNCIIDLVCIKAILHVLFETSYDIDNHNCHKRITRPCGH